MKINGRWVDRELPRELAGFCGANEGTNRRPSDYKEKNSVIQHAKDKYISIQYDLMHTHGWHKCADRALLLLDCQKRGVAMTPDMEIKKFNEWLDRQAVV